MIGVIIMIFACAGSATGVIRCCQSIEMPISTGVM